MSDYDGPERRRGYEQLAEELDKHVGEIEKRFQRWFRAGLLIVAVIGLTSFVGLFGFGYAIKEIQHQRKDACLSLNDRHDRAVEQLRDDTAKRIEESPDNAQDILDAQARAINLINALAPVQNCNKTVSPPLEGG